MMNTLCNSRQSAITLISHLYSVENTNLFYYKVLANKVRNSCLKKVVVKQLIPSIEKKKKSLYLIIRLMDLHPQDSNTSVINLIINECFIEIDNTEDEELIDNIILRTLVALLHYELGNYRMLLSHLENIDHDHKSSLMKDILNSEEQNLNILMDTLKINE